MELKQPLWALGVAILMASGCGDTVLEGPLKTCILEVAFTEGGCTLCGEAVLDGEIVNTQNFTVLRSERKAGFDDYDDFAAETCSTFWPPGDGAVGSLQQTRDCEALGFTQQDAFEFANGQTETYNHDGSCTTFSEV